MLKQRDEKDRENNIKLEKARRENTAIDLLFERNLKGSLEPNLFGSKMDKLEEEMRREYESLKRKSIKEERTNMRYRNKLYNSVDYGSSSTKANT